MVRWQPHPEPTLVPYAAVEPLPAGPLLVLAPHPDDEVFGCGGTIARACDSGIAVHVAVATDGGAAGDAAVREAESRCAAAVLAGSGRPPQLEFWRCGDRALVPDAQLCARVAAAVAACAPRWVAVPSPFEVHPDHRALCLAAVDAVAASGATLAFYEVGQPLLADTLVDITGVLARKRAAMACFGSQLALHRYDETTEALNRLRAYTLPPPATHAEAYWLPRSAAGTPLTAAAVLEDARSRLAQRLSLA